MSFIVIPTSTDPFYRQTTSLQGTDYIFRFQYSTREDCWYMSIATSSDVELQSCIKLMCNTLLLRSADPQMPPGVMMVVSSTDDDSPPGLLDLDPDNGRCQLTYAEAPPL